MRIIDIPIPVNYTNALPMGSRPDFHLYKLSDE